MSPSNGGGSDRVSTLVVSRCGAPSLPQINTSSLAPLSPPAKRPRRLHSEERDRGSRCRGCIARSTCRRRLRGKRLGANRTRPSRRSRGQGKSRAACGAGPNRKPPLRCPPGSLRTRSSRISRALTRSDTNSRAVPSGGASVATGKHLARSRHPRQDGYTQDGDRLQESNFASEPVGRRNARSHEQSVRSRSARCSAFIVPPPAPQDPRANRFPSRRKAPALHHRFQPPLA